MVRINLCGGSYDAKYASVAAQRCLNLYAEPIPAADGEPIQFAYYPRPGLRQIASFSGASRCAYQSTRGDALFVIGGDLILLRKNGSTRVIGSISANNNQVRMSDNGTTLFIVDGTNQGGWYCDMTGGEYGAPVLIQDAAFYGSSTIGILDTFFLFVNPQTTNWYTSPAQFSDEKTTPFDPLYVASDTTSLTTIKAISVVGQYIWLFGTLQTELWYDSGAADFPFQRVQGVTIEVGAVSPFGIATIPTSAAAPNGGVIWLGQDRTGSARVYLGQQTLAAPISTFPIENALREMGDLSAAVASTYQQGGHIFYVLTIPGQAATWVYDVSTGLWHERCSLDASGNEAQYRPLNWCAAYGKIWAVDYSNGAIYEVDPDAPDDAGAPIKRQRAFPHLLTDGRRGIHRQFGVDMQNGAGQSVSVDWSDDRGATFGTDQTLALGGAGNIWPTLWRLGMARDRVYRLTWTAPGPTALMGAFINVDPVRT